MKCHVRHDWSTDVKAVNAQHCVLGAVVAGYICRCTMPRRNEAHCAWRFFVLSILFFLLFYFSYSSPARLTSWGWAALADFTPGLKPVALRADNPVGVTEK